MLTQDQTRILTYRITKIYSKERHNKTSVHPLWDRISEEMNIVAGNVHAPHNTPQGWRSFYRRYVSGTHSLKQTQEIALLSLDDDDEPVFDTAILQVVGSDIVVGGVVGDYDTSDDTVVVPPSTGSVAYYRQMVDGMSDKELHNWLFGVKNEFGVYDALELDLPANFGRVLVVADVHFPFVKVGYLSAIIHAIKTLKPDAVMFIGDLLDEYVFSAWPKQKNTMNGNTEIGLARAMLLHWEREIAKFDIPVYAVLGNHDARLYRLMNEIGLTTSTMAGLTDYLSLPESWNYAHSWIDQYNNIEYTHVPPKGGTSPHTISLAEMTGSLVCGHYHMVAGVTCNKRGQWGMSVGTALDPKLYANAYSNTANHKIKGVTFGYGVVNKARVTGLSMGYVNLKGTMFDV